MAKKILIIKLGALGDVLRTRSILIGLKEKYPDSEIWWITKPDSKQVLVDDPLINHILTTPINFIEEKFDELYNFDIEEEATKLAQGIFAEKKFGFYSEDGFVASFNFPSEYYLNTLFDDELKKTNKKTYQEMMFEVAELCYKQQHSYLNLTEQDKQYADKFIQENNIDTSKLIGIHIGYSSRWPSRSWTYEKIKDFVIKAKEKEYNILLFGGINEKEKQDKLSRELGQQGVTVYKNNPDNTLKQFASLVNICYRLICSDSLSLHTSLALKKPTIGLFFCTSPDEIEGYGLLTKIVSPLLYDYFPEKMDEYSEELMESIPVEEVLTALEKMNNPALKREVSELKNVKTNKPKVEKI